jgi:O-antigen ligase
VPRTLSADETTPRWLSWLIALVPVIPPLYFVAFGGLNQLGRFTRPVKWVLALFVVCQLVAALFTPYPADSLVLAALRCLFMLALLGAGVYLGSSRRLLPALWGLILVYLTAWVSSAYTYRNDLLHVRLGHPYVYIVSLGLYAVIGFWMVIAWKGGWRFWKLLAALLALATLVAAGSRGPLLAMGFGSLAALLRGGRRYLIPIATLAALGLAALGLGILHNHSPFERLGTTGLTGRNHVWNEALRAFAAHPVGGVGPYQLGPYLPYLYRNGCMLTPLMAANHVGCPPLLQHFRGAWLIAHDVLLQSLGESGVVGTVGLAALFVLVALAVWRSRDPFLAAIFWGFLAMSTVDVLTAVPSIGMAELFWVCAGVALWRSGGVVGGLLAPAD